MIILNNEYVLNIPFTFIHCLLHSLISSLIINRQLKIMKPKFIKAWSGNGNNDGQFNNPRGVAVGRNGIIYVSDSSNHRIQCFDSNGNFICKWGRRGDGDGEFKYPAGLTISFNETKIKTKIMNVMRSVPELESYPWRAFKDSGKLNLFEYGSSLKLDAANPGDLSVDLGNCARSLRSSKPFSGILSICMSYINIEYIYVADSENHRIQVFDVSNLEFDLKSDIRSNSPTYRNILSAAVELSNIKFIRKWGSYGSDDGKFHNPFKCAIDKEEMVYVVDTLNSRIQVFDIEGRFICKWGSCGIGKNKFWCPSSIFITEIGVLDSESEMKSIRSAGLGSEVKSINSSISGSGAQMIYIADTGNNRVVCYEKNDPRQMPDEFKLVCEFGSIRLDLLKYPMDLIVDENTSSGVSTVYIVDCQTNNITQFLSDGTFLQKWKCDHSKNIIAMAKGVNLVNGRSVMYVVDMDNKIIVMGYDNPQ